MEETRRWAKESDLLKVAWKVNSGPEGYRSPELQPFIV
jgi:hypothetical protein